MVAENRSANKEENGTSLKSHGKAMTEIFT
jgi:hypothetical protein